MSLILDALKKIERQSRGRDRPEGESSVIMEGGRRWGERSRILPLGSVWIALVALVALILSTVAVLTVLRGPRPPVGAPGPVETTSAPPAGDTPPAPPAVSSPESPAEDAAASREEPPISSPALPVEGPDGVSRQPDVPPEEEIETAPPVRLVGAGSGKAGPAHIEETDQSPPAGSPPLVLQGTAVVDGKPVAVINYQRVFIGDTIEGARVLRISDREVEVEYKGKRFTIRL